MNTIKTIITAGILWVASSPLYAGEMVIDNPNDNQSLLIFVAGLGGAETWDSLITIMRNDSELKKFDAYVYNPLASGGNISQSSKELKRIIESNLLSSYQNLYIVAHSIGGIITKDYLLERLNTSSPTDMKEKHILFIGTPHIKSNFNAPIYKRLLGFTFYFFLGDLAKDALNATGIKSINTNWLNIVESNQNKYIKNLVLFGNDDDIVAPEELNNTFLGDYLVIEGTHLGIAQSTNEFSCTYQIMKRKLLNPDANMVDLGCSVN